MKFAFFNLILLLFNPLFGTGYSETGNNSWIRFDINGVNIGFQPGEIGKIIFIFTLAKHFKVLGKDINSLRGLISLLLHCLLTAGFVYLFSKDDGMAVSYLFIFIIMAFAGGIYLRYCMIGIVGIAASIPLLWSFVFGDYQRDRFIVLFDETYKTNSIGYHQSQSVAAIQSGGFGVTLATAQYPNMAICRQNRPILFSRLPARSLAFRRLYNHFSVNLNSLDMRLLRDKNEG